MAIGYLDLLSSMSGEYLFGGLPRLCLKGRVYPAGVSILFIKEVVVKLLTSGIFSGDGSAGTERWGDSGSSPDGVVSVAEGPLDSKGMSGPEDVSLDSSPIISVSF